MTKFRHLTWMLIAAIGLVLSTSQSHAQSQDPGDQPGLVADDGYELDPEWKKQVVLLPHHRSAGHDHRRRPPSATSIWCRATAAPSATASASAAKASSGRGS